MAGFRSVDELFEGRHFDREIIVLCVRWYLRFKLSFRDLVEMMAERGLSMAHTTIMRWVHHYVPEFERRWNQFARPAGSVVARRRDLREDPRQVGVFIPGGRSRGKDCRLSAQHQARRHRSQGVLLQGDQSARIDRRGPSHWTVMRHRIAPCAICKLMGNCQPTRSCAHRSI